MSDDALYRRFFRALPDACLIVDRGTSRLLDANEAADALYGWNRNEEVEVPPLAESAELRRGDGLVPIETSQGTFTLGNSTLVGAVTRDVSAQRRFEHQLRESQALLASTFDQSPLLMLISSLPDRRHLRVNDAFCRVTGYTREEVVGRTSAEVGLVDPEHPRAIDDALARDHRLAAREVRLYTRARESIHVRIWSEVIETSSGPLLFTTGEDFTARRTAELARAQLHERLQKIASSLNGVIFEMRSRPNGGLTVPYASRALVEFFGVRPEDAREDATSAFASIHPEDLPHALEGVERSRRELTPWDNDHRVVGPDGRTRWMRVNAVPELQADGAVLWRGFVADITERKANETALRVSRERVKLALEATSDTLWDWHLSSRPDGFEAWQSEVHPDDLTRARAASQPCIDGLTERFEVEVRLRAKDGAWRWFLSRGKVLERDASGRATRILGTNADITDRKQLQLTLAQTERLASMGLLAAGVAHEINNPLAYVQANLDSLSQDLPRLVGFVRRALEALRAKAGEGAVSRLLAGRDGPLDDALSSISTALDGAQRIRKISRGLDTFARAEKSEREPIDVNHAIESAATMAHDEVKSRARLVKELSPLPAVIASEGKLAQVFLNLLVNAAHAIPEGAGASNEIRVRSWAEDHSVIVEVADTGRGMSSETLARIFEPFFTTKGTGQGSGLGLSISRSIIVELGGTIDAESTPGSGTRMRVRLPASPELTARPSRPPAVPRVEAHGATARVLVVDDEPAIRRSLERVLRMHEVVTAASGREARVLIERGETFDVIICDLMMPEMTGMELHAWLAESHPALAQRVVFLSGGAFTPAAAEYLERVDNLRLEKPFDSARLKALVAERAALAWEGRS